MTQSFHDIMYRHTDGIGWITINRPQVLNAFRPLTIDEMLAAFEDAWHNEAIGVVVLSGAQGNFCSGGDQKIRGEGGYNDEEGMPRMGPQPVERPPGRALEVAPHGGDIERDRVGIERLAGERGQERGERAQERTRTEPDHETGWHAAAGAKRALGRQRTGQRPRDLAHDVEDRGDAGRREELPGLDRRSQQEARETARRDTAEPGGPRGEAAGDEEEAQRHAEEDVAGQIGKRDVSTALRVPEGDDGERQVVPDGGRINGEVKGKERAVNDEQEVRPEEEAGTTPRRSHA